MVWCYYSNETYFAELLLTTLFYQDFENIMIIG